MRFFAPASRASLLLAAAALCFTAGRAHITVQDNFVDEAAREDILAQLPTQARFKHTLDLPGQLYSRLLSVLHPRGADLSLTETSVPAKGEGRMVPAHQDVFEDSSLVEGPVGLVYLEGDGRMLFKHETTGEETVVDVQPGRLLSWDNRLYAHTLIPGDMPRRILGPMAFRDGGMQSIGDFSPRVLAQAYANSLTVRAGGLAKVTLTLVVLDLGRADGRKRAVRKLENLDLIIGCEIRDFSVDALGGGNKTDKADTADDVLFKSSRLTPNSFKPKLKVEDVGGVGGVLAWTLPSEGIKILHQYKVTWSARVGKDVPSGTVIPFFIFVEGEWDEMVEVLVK